MPQIEIIEKGEKRIHSEIYRPKDYGFKGESKNCFPAVIMSHGYNSSCRDWLREGRFLAEHGYVVIAFDFCGGSSRSLSNGKSEDMTVTSETEDLIDVFGYVSEMEEVDSNRIFLHGASMGGLVTAQVAEKLKKKLAGVSLYFPAFCVSDDWTPRYDRPEDADDVIPFWGMNLGRGFVFDIHGRDLVSEVGRYDGKVLIIHGTDDEVVPVDYAKRVSKRYKNSELVILDGEGHGFSEEGTAFTSAKLLEFYESI